MTQMRNTVKTEGPDWLRMWVFCAIFCGVSGAVYDLLKSLGNDANNPEIGLQAMVYTSVVAALFFFARALISKRNVKKAAFTLLGVCAAGVTLIQITHQTMNLQSQPSVAQTQGQL